MTNPNEIHGLPPLTEAVDSAHNPALDPTTYFSSDSLALFGEDGVRELLSTREWLENIHRQGEEQTPRPAPSENCLEGSPIGEYFDQNPWFNDFSEQADALLRRHCEIIEQPETPEGWRQLNKVTRAIHKLYQANKDRFVPLAHETIDEALNAQLAEFGEQINLVQRIYDLRNDHDNTTDAAQRRHIASQIRDQLHEAKIPDVQLVQRVCRYLQAELIMGKHEQFAIRQLSGEDLELSAGKEGFKPLASDRFYDTHPDTKFHSPTQIENQKTHAAKMIDLAHDVSIQLADHFQHYKDILVDYRQAEAQTMAVVAARAFATAEDTVSRQLRNGEVDLNFNEFPFTLIARDPETGINPDELNVLLTLTKERMLWQPRQELRSFLETASPAWPIDFEQELTRMRLEAGSTPHTRELSEACKAVLPMIGRSLDALQPAVQAVCDVLDGKKPRAKKKEPTPEQIAATKIYDGLHNAGFSKPEKALATAIVTNKWERLLAAQKQTSVMVDAIAEFTKMFELGDLASNYPAHFQAATAPFESILRSMAGTIRKNQKQVLQVLSSNQFSHLKAFVDATTRDSSTEV